MFNVSINPMDYLNYKQNKDFNADMTARTEAQRKIDNAFREKQFTTQEQWNTRKWNDRNTVLQRLKQDAGKAGVSMLAALGGQGQSPQNISMPVGQGGRVSGNYQRQSAPEAKITATFMRNQALDTDMKEIERELRMLDLLFKNKQYQDFLNPVEPQYPKLYLRGKNNYDEAVQMLKEGDFPYNNPDMNLEMPESVGGYYFTKPRPEGFFNP